MQKHEIENQIEFLFSAALKKCGNIEDAQDLTQDTLLAALTYLSNGKTINNLKSWLITVLNRKYFYKLRQKYKISVVSIGNEAELIDETDYFENIGKPEEAEGVRKAVAYLSKIHREVAVRYYLNGESTEKISHDLGIPQGTVKSRLSNSRRQLKKELDNMENYTKQSYEPVRLSVTNSGMRGINGEPASLVEGNLIVQNLLYLAYGEPITELDLAKAIGIPTAYVEPIIEQLVNGELMRRVGNKIYTDFIISTAADQEKYIPAQKQLVSDNSDLFLRSVRKGLEKVRNMDCYKRFTFDQRNAFELYVMFNCLDKGVYSAFSKIYNSTQTFPARPNGGKWIAFGHIVPPDYDLKNYIEQVKHSYAGERHTHLDNYFSSKSISFHVYDPEGFQKRLYYKCKSKFVIEDDSLLKLLYVIESGVNIANTGFNTELFKTIPWLVDCKILRYDNNKAAVDIPVISFDEWKIIKEILNTAQNEFAESIIELLKEFLKDKKQEIPKHLISVPLQKQYLWSQIALIMATIRLAIQKGIIYNGNYDDDSSPENQCPYPMVFIIDR